MVIWSHFTAWWKWWFNYDSLMRHTFKDLFRSWFFFFFPPKFLIRTKVTVEMQGYVWVIYSIVILVWIFRFPLILICLKCSDLICIVILYCSVLQRMVSVIGSHGSLWKLIASEQWKLLSSLPFKNKSFPCGTDWLFFPYWGKDSIKSVGGQVKHEAKGHYLSVLGFCVSSGVKWLQSWW